MTTSSKTKWVLILILIGGLALRIVYGAKFFNYTHDQDLAGWIIKDVLVNHHPRLIGQLTSTPGVFIGPLFYYLLIPFYLAFRMDAVGGIYLVAALGTFAIWSCFYVFSKVFGRNTGLIGSLIYAVSPYIVFNDREVVPTMPLMLWSIWFFYSLHLIIKGDQKKGLLLAAVLAGLIWHINFGLVILLPIYLISLIISKKKFNLKTALVALVVFVVLSLPLILFEARHGYSQTKAIYYSATQSQGDVIKGSAKIGKIYDVVIKGVTDLLWGYPAGIPKSLAFWVVSVSSMFIFVKGKISKKVFLIMFLWFAVTVSFFTIYSKPVSEYYLNSMTIIWVALLSVIFISLIEAKKLAPLGYLLLICFVSLSVYRFFKYPSNHQGYIERKEVVSYIKQDSLTHNYPCVAISYITNPGYNLGYRYFFWRAEVTTRPVSSNAPVYTIVFPLNIVDRFDKSFGALGVINPDYSRYNKTSVAKSCEGENFNLTDSMFGYTQ
jgi:4-amino-4-deoxy-L-arabinose transferase-like glycosyltransferase